VAVNVFDGTKRYMLDEVASALALPAGVPVIEIDARDRESAKQALIRVTEYALRRLTQSLSAPLPSANDVNGTSRDDSTTDWS